MRWCLLLLNLFILLTLGMEQCCWCAAAVTQDASHLVCVLDDDDAELKQGLPHETTFSDCGAPAMPDWHEALRLAHADLLVPHSGAELWKAHAGVRWHRWLRQERC